MNEKKNIFLIASLGFGIRNFVAGKFSDLIKDNFNLYLFTYLYNDEIFLEFIKRKNIHPLKIEEIFLNKKWKKVKSLRDGLHVAYLNNETWKLKQSRIHHEIDIKDEIKNKLIMGFLKVIKSKRILEIFDKLETNFSLKSKTAEYYIKIFQEKKPSLIFSLCPLRPEEWIPIQIGKQMGVKTALFILSWDNLSTKQRPPLPVDYIFVWNESMKEELLRNCPGSEKAEIVVSGTPQFDFYFDIDYIETKENFFKRMGLDLEKKLIVYSGVTPSLMPEENLIVEKLAEDLKSKIKKPAQLLIRLHPKDGGERYKELKERFKDVVFSIPGENSKGDIFKWNPDQEEIKNLVNIVRYSDVLINVASTMTIDSSLMDRPVINVRYYFSKNASKPPWGIYIYETTHYKPLIFTGGFKVAKTHEELINFINIYLENPKEDAEGRKKIVEMVCGKPDGEAGKRIARKILEIL